MLPKGPPFNTCSLCMFPCTDISAYPDSVNVLEGVEGDVRTPDKLINGVNATQDGKSMWLAPVLPALLNKIYVIFDQPMQISMIKLWNYSKSLNGGSKELLTGSYKIMTSTGAGRLWIFHGSCAELRRRA